MSVFALRLPPTSALAFTLCAQEWCIAFDTTICRCCQHLCCALRQSVPRCGFARFPLNSCRNVRQFEATINCRHCDDVFAISSCVLNYIFSDLRITLLGAVWWELPWINLVLSVRKGPWCDLFASLTFNSLRMNSILNAICLCQIKSISLTALGGITQML